MKVAFVTTDDAADIKAWSGIFYYAAKALASQGIDVDPIGPLRMRYETLFKCKEGIFRYFLRRQHPRDREPLIAKLYARQVMAKLRQDHDLVFGVGTLAISYLECPQPIVVWSDATFASSVDFYPRHTKLSAESLRDGNFLEDAALRRCRRVIYSSDWAAESAIEDYGIERERVAVVPFGANLDRELSASEVQAAVAHRSDSICRLLFIGAEWERKGGPKAIAVAAELNASGLATELDVVGSWPSRGRLPTFVNRLGFIDKSTAAGQEELQRLLMRSHFLLLPSRADCTPVVLSEAAAHALPALTTSVGGIPTIVRDDVNGKLFALEADPSVYAAYVLDVVANPERYRQLALASFEEYQDRLNWTAAAAAVCRVIDDALRESDER